MPKRRDSFFRAFWIIMAIYFFLLLVSILKTLKIIPDPPEYESLIREALSAIIGIAITYFYHYITGLSQRIDELSSGFNKLQNEVERLGDGLKHLRDYLELNTRITRLEARLERLE